MAFVLILCAAFSACSSTSGRPLTPFHVVTPAPASPSPLPTPTQVACTPASTTLCNAGPFTPGPIVTTPIAQHVYVGVNGAAGSSILELALPLSSASPATYALASQEVYPGFAIDSAGRLLTADSGNNQFKGFSAYALPFAASIPALFSFGDQYEGETFDESGDLLTNGSCRGSCVAIFQPPISASSVPAHEIAGGGSIAVAGHRIFVDDNDSVTVYDPPYVVPTVSFALGGISAQQVSRTSLLADPSGNLIVGTGYASRSGSLYVYSPPFASGTMMPAFSLSPQGVPEGLALDGQGHLLVSVTACLDCTAPTDDAIVVYALPLTATSQTTAAGYSLSSYSVTGSVAAGP